MEYASLNDSNTTVSRNGERIRWAGSTASGHFMVVTATEKVCLKRYVCNPMSWRPDAEPTRTLSFVDCDEGSDKGISVSPEDSTSMSQSRRAAVFGVNIGGDCTSGACKKYDAIEGCTLSYDIETSTKSVREGGFGLVDEEILSIAGKCSCSAEFYINRMEAPPSSELVLKFVLFVIDHMLIWMVGWNCYTFDNKCMRYWCDDSLKDIFSVSRVGVFGKPSYSSILNIPGVYNMNLMVYMNKSLYRLPSFKLGDVAE